MINLTVTKGSQRIGSGPGLGQGLQPGGSTGAGQHPDPPQQLLSQGALVVQGLPQAPLKGRVGTPLSFAWASVIVVCSLAVGKTRGHPVRDFHVKQKQALQDSSLKPYGIILFNQNHGKCW